MRDKLHTQVRESLNFRLMPLPGSKRIIPFQLIFDRTLPSDIERKRAERHVSQSKDGEILQLNKSGGQFWHGTTTGILHLQSYEILYRFRNVEYICAGKEKKLDKCYGFNRLRTITNKQKALKLQQIKSQEPDYISNKAKCVDTKGF